MIQELFSLDERVALVTGAASGMGRAMALAFASAGADLLIADINVDGLGAAAAEIEALGRRVLPAACDVTDIEQIRAMFARLDKEFGRIDVLANVAGPGELAKPEDIDLALMADVVHGLTVARFCCCQEAGRRMLAAGGRQHHQHLLDRWRQRLGAGQFPL